MKRRPSKGVPAPRDSGDSGDSGNHITAVSVSRHWEGPLPNPEALERFDQVVPNGAERIFKMAEVEHAHRIAYETEALRVSVAEAKRGQYLGALPSRFLRWLARSGVC